MATLSSSSNTINTVRDHSIAYFIFPGAHDRQNLISWRWSLHLQTEFGEDRCTQFRVIVVTDTARPAPARLPTCHKRRPPVRPSARHRQDRLQYTAPLCLARSIIYYHLY